MDTSIRLKNIEAIFGGNKVRISELDASRARCMACEILGASKPYMTYLAGFVPLNDYVGDMLTEDLAKRVQTDNSTIYSLPRGIFSQTRVHRLATVVSEQWGFNSPNARRKRVRGYVYLKELLITHDGTVLVWDWFARCNYRREKQQNAIRSKFRVLDGAQLATYMSDPRTALATVTAIGWLVTDTIETRKQRLVAMESLDSFIKAVENYLRL